MENELEEEGRQLERMGYRFEAKEEPITEPGHQGSYFRVYIRHNDLLLGTRSELQQERALARAYRFARRHSEGENPLSI